MKKTLIPLLLAGSSLLAGCDQEANNSSATSSSSATPAASTPAAPKVDKADAVAVVNGKYIAKTTLDSLEKEIGERTQGQSFPKEKLIEELIQRELLIQDALQKKLDKSPEIVAQLEEAKKSFLIQADVQNFIKTSPVTDEEIKAEYDSKVGGANGTEYKARHILVKTEAEAKKIIADLDKKSDFAKLANKHSLDAKDSQNGGDLGWFAPSQMVEPFANAVIALEKGKYTKTPVQTQFGWHVILSEDSRPQTPPPLEAIKEQIAPLLQRKKLQSMVENLRKQAKVEILIPLTEPAPAPVAEPAPAAPTDAAAPATTTESAPAPTPAPAAEPIAEPAPAPVAEPVPAPAAEPAPAEGKK